MTSKRNADVNANVNLIVKSDLLYILTPIPTPGQYLGASLAQCLTHCSRETRKRVTGKQFRPRSDAWSDQMLWNVASDQGLHCLQIV